MKLNLLLLGFALVTSTIFYSCKPSDTQVQKAANEVLKASPELAGITASVKDGIATLTGEVTEASLKTKAASLLKDVEGLKSITNNITVKSPLPPVTQSMDTQLQSAVKDAIKDFEGVEASVTNGVITLTGTIEQSKLPTLMQSLNALSPKKIENQLTIK